MKAWALAAIPAFVFAAITHADEPALANPIAVLVMPDALKTARARANAIGDDLWMGVNIVGGNPTGLRAEAYPIGGETLRLGFEGIGGEQMGSWAGGAGARIQIRLAGGERNAFFASPGVDVYFSPPQASGFGHYEWIYYVATDLDVSWVHRFTRYFGFETGIKAGGEIGLNAPSWLSLTHVAALPELGIFVGVRF